MNKRIFIFGGVFVSLCMLFLVHDVKSNDKNKEKYFISIEKHSDGKGVTMTIKKNDNKTVVNTCQLEKKNSLANDKFQNVYSLQDNDIAEILSNSECEFLDGNNKKVEDKSILAIGTLERIHNPILRFFFSCILEDKQYVIYCDDANSVKVGEDVYGLFEESKATKIVILRCGSEIKDMNSMFLECSSLTNLDLSKFTTNKVTNMGYMFAYCSSLTKLNLSNFNTSNVKDMNHMFYKCSSLTNINLSKFNTNNVTNMSNMFFNCSSLNNLDLSKFNTNKVTNMRNMFHNCSLTNINLSSFNTNNVTYMGCMFSGCSSLTKLDLSNFNTKNVTEMFGMFYNCSSLTELNLSSFNTNNVTDIREMFYKCFTEKQTSTLICKASTIQNITNENQNSGLIIQNENKEAINKELNGNLEKVYKCSVERKVEEIKPQITEVEEYKLKNIQEDGKVDDIQIVNEKFAKMKLVNAYIYRGSTEKDYNDAKTEFLESIALTCQTHLSAYVEVKDKDTVKLRCFIHCKDANSISDEDDNYDGLFEESKATKIVILSCGNNITNMSWMFSDCSKLITIKFSDKINTDKVTNMQGMFCKCSNLTNINLSHFNTNNVKDMSFMFHNCSSLTNLNLSKFNTNDVTNMFGMFSGCSSLKELDLSKFNTDNVTYMSHMFHNCRSLTELDLSNFNTDNIEDMSAMFYLCTSLNNINLSNWKTHNVTDMGLMFANCTSLTELNLSNFITQKVTNMCGMFSECRSLTELDLSNFITDNVTDMYGMFNECFKAGGTATLICKESTIKKITNNKDSRLTIPNEKNIEINDKLNENQDQVCTCTVKREGKDINPQITALEEYKQKQ